MNSPNCKTEIGKSWMAAVKLLVMGLAKSKRAMFPHSKVEGFCAKAVTSLLTSIPMFCIGLT